MKIEIDSERPETLQNAIKCGVTNIESLFDVFGDEYSLIEGCLVKDDAPICVSDGDAEKEYDCEEDVDDVVEEFFDSCDWGEVSKSFVHRCQSYRKGINQEGRIERVEVTLHKRVFHPSEPVCVGKKPHMWESPEKLGGCRENPGVWGHGGGVIIHDVCSRCGCKRITDTWGQDTATGEQGFTFVSYEGE